MTTSDRLGSLLGKVTASVFVVTITATAYAHELRGDEAAAWATAAGLLALAVVLVTCLAALAAQAAPGAQSDQTVRIGSRVAVADAQTGRKVSYRIVPDEQALEADTLPASSPVARALLGARPQQTVDVVERTLVVDQVERES